ILQKCVDYEYLIDKVSLQNVINISRLLINPDIYGIASHHFSRLRSNEVGDLVCVIDDESFDWKLIRTIDNLKANNERIEHQYCPQFFHKLLRKEIIFKVQAKRISTQGYCSTFKVINVISDARFFNKLQADKCIKDVSSDSGFSPIFEDFSRYGQLRSYENQVISGVPIQLHSIKEMLADILCDKIYSSASRNSTDDYTVPNGMISQLMNKKIVFIVDPRPVGYELNTSLHVVRPICDDVEIVKFLEDSSHDNQQQ
ncbi:hypothetical protein S245_052913, partial [Arachis hypogaea]